MLHFASLLIILQKLNKVNMNTLEEIFAEGRKPEDIIADLCSCSKDVPSWTKLVKLYDENQHPIKSDPTLRPLEKSVEEGQRDVPAKISYPAEKIAVRRMTQMAFSIPVKRLYSTTNENEKKFAEAIENVYKAVRIDGVNSKRMKAYFASSEMATVWYVTDNGGEKHEKYGFPTSARIRCKSYSPMPSSMSKISQADTYPLFDETGDLIALSFRYSVNVNGKDVEKFECFTAQNAFYWSNGENGWEVEEKENVTGKILASYISSPSVIYDGIQDFRNEIEFANSRESDVVKKNSSPIIVVSGDLVGAPPVNGRGREAYQLKNGGNVSLLNPAMSADQVKTHINTQKEFISEVTQMPNLSMENIKGLGAMTGEARKSLLADAHLKVGEESHDIIWFLDREFSVIKSILASINPAWKSLVNKVTCDHIITPFTQNDQTAQTDRLSKRVDSRLLSRRSAIEQFDDVADVDEEIKRINEEMTADMEAQRAVSVFESGM